MDNAHVLVVEDDDTIRRLLVEYLGQQAALSVEGARDGIEALHRISRKHYELVVLDLMMPLMSGVDFLDSVQALRADPSVTSLTRQPRVLIITGAPQAEVPAETLQRRFPTLVKGVFRKPLDVELLAGVVESELRR